MIPGFCLWLLAAGFWLLPSGFWFLVSGFSSGVRNAG
jgi:hypothetical protein